MMIDHPELDPELDHELDPDLEHDDNVLRRRDDGRLKRQVNGWRGGSFHQYTGDNIPMYRCFHQNKGLSYLACEKEDKMQNKQAELGWEINQ